MLLYPGRKVYHIGRKQWGTFLGLDERNTEINNCAWVLFDDDELMISTEQLRGVISIDPERG